MIEKILFKAGAVRDSPPLEVEVSPITVFVGPNNSGKSKVLREIESFIASGNRESAKTKAVVLDGLNFSPISKEEIEADIDKFATQSDGTPVSSESEHFVLAMPSHANNNRHKAALRKSRLVAEAADPNRNHVSALSDYLMCYTARLDGAGRLNLVNEVVGGDLQTPDLNLLTYLFATDSVRKEVRRIVHEAFDKYFVIDPTRLGHLRVRFSDRQPCEPEEERGIDGRAVTFHGAAKPIEDASDGVKAFVGILATLLAGENRIILIDEPEAFLHPSLAHKLGKEIALSLKGSDKRLFVSTHSAQFLMGCIQSGVPTNIVRLTYNFAPPTTRLLSQDRILELMREPLLRSTKVLDGLFFEAVIVTEADTDRAFYQEINERLLMAGDKRGIPNALFLNAQNKQTVWKIVRPLRELGIPAAGIVDIDVLLDGGKEFSKVLQAAFLPDVSHIGMHTERNSLANLVKEQGVDLKQDGGVQALTEKDKEGAENLLRRLQEYGVFVVDHGEVESWLRELKIQGHGSPWLIQIFERLGSDPDDSQYVRPAPGDVWDFMSGIGEWLTNPNRKGIPSDDKHK